MVGIRGSATLSQDGGDAELFKEKLTFLFGGEQAGAMHLATANGAITRSRLAAYDI